MKIRIAEHSDLDIIFNIYDYARNFMKEHGNPEQWGNVYPSKELIISDLEQGALFVVADDNNAPVGVFSYFPDGDPDYDTINGAWLNDEPYTAIHRIASAGTHKGIFACIFDYCLSLSSNIKIDTYIDNTIMQAILKKHGFKACGTISVCDMEFIAFQFTK